VDIDQVPFRTLTASGILIGILAVGVSGCKGSSGGGASQQVTTKIKEQVAKAGRKQAASTVEVSGEGNSFMVDDEKGRRLIEAKVERVDGAMRPDQGMQGPVLMKKLKCRLFQDGKPQLDLVAPEATWDGKELRAEKTAHGTTPDGTTVIDAQKAIWTAKGGGLALDGAKLKALKKGQETFVADAPKATVIGDLITMPAGAEGRNPEGKRLQANHVRWHRESGRLEANGNVLVADKDTEVTGQRLQADTKLQKGRFSGNTRVRAKAGKIKARKA
jgi:hypothetical protein